MKMQNIRDMENLSLYTHFSGLITIFLGILVIMIDLINKDFGHIQVGIFILITGYAFFKISQKIAHVLKSEKVYV